MATETAETVQAIPHYTLEGIEAYVKWHRPPGDFLRAVLSNDLIQACSHADPDNRAALFEIVQHVWNHVRGDCWGSRLAVETWLAASKEVVDAAPLNV